MARRARPKPRLEPARPATTAHAIAAAAAVVLVARLSLVPIRSEDIFFYLALGRRLFAEGRLPDTDPYLFTLARYRWEILHEWGSYALSHVVYVASGLAGLVAGKTVLLVAAYAAPFVIARRYDLRSPLVALIVIVAAFAGAPRFIERSSLFSDVFGTAVLAFVLMALPRSDTALRWREPTAVAALFALWANLHPGFFTGLVLLALAVVARLVSRHDAKREAMRLGAATLACLLNPRGPRVFAYPLRPLLDPDWAAFRATNLEWRSTLHPANLALTSTHAFLALVAASVGLLAWALYKKKARLHEPDVVFALTAGVWLTYLGLSAVRFILPGAMGLAVLATFLAHRAGALDVTRGMRGLSFALTLFVAYAVTQRETPGDRLPLPVPGHASLIDETLVPVRAAEAVGRLDPEVRIFNQHEFGGYLIWRFGGARKVFHHGFVTDLRFYRDDYVAVNRSAEDFARIVEKYDIGAFLLAAYPASPTEGPLLYRTLLSSPEWRLVHADDAAMLFLKPPSRAR